MNGLELSRAFYEQYGAPLLHEQFSQVEHLIAVGLIGSGSEVLGFDDEVSRDHDFEPSFCLLLPDESVIDRRTAFLLERAYAKLPREFMEVRRSTLAPVGGARHGVLRAADFFTEKVGAPDGVLTVDQWLKLPQQSLLEATAGVLFRDDLGQVTAIRTALSHMPEEVRKKRLAGHLLLMAQAGQYNYLRCLKHGEPAAGQLAVNEFVKSCIEVVFLLNRVYAPYYKWSFRALRQLEKLSLTAETLEYLLTTGNDEDMAESKYDMIESTASDIIDELQEQGLTKAICGDLEKHAYSVNDGIEDGDVRNLNILYAI